MAKRALASLVCAAIVAGCGGAQLPRPGRPVQAQAPRLDGAGRVPCYAAETTGRGGACLNRHRPVGAARGSAAVPSTADIYINNVKTYSQDVNTGPFMLSNLPAVTGSGTARVILRDSSGKTTESVRRLSEDVKAR